MNTLERSPATPVTYHSAVADGEPMLPHVETEAEFIARMRAIAEQDAFEAHQPLPESSRADQIIQRGLGWLAMRVRAVGEYFGVIEPRRQRVAEAMGNAIFSHQDLEHLHQISMDARGFTVAAERVEPSPDDTQTSLQKIRAMLAEDDGPSELLHGNQIHLR